MVLMDVVDLITMSNHPVQMQDTTVNKHFDCYFSACIQHVIQECFGYHNNYYCDYVYLRSGGGHTM